MPYYSKQEVLDYVNVNLQEMDSKGVKPLTPLDEVVMRLENEEDMVGFFWIDYSEGEGDSKGIKMNGKAYIRVDHDIYTDDRFAIDLYNSAKEGCTVSDIIKKREIDRELAKQGISDQSTLEDKIKESKEKAQNKKEDGA